MCSEMTARRRSRRSSVIMRELYSASAVSDRGLQRRPELLVAMLPLDGGQVGRPRERGAREQDEAAEQPRVFDPAPAPVDDGPHGEEQNTHDRVVLAGRTGRGVGVAQRDELPPAPRTPEEVVRGTRR